jgi:hypothetical protein
MSNDSPAVILYDVDGNPVAITDGDFIESFQKGIIFAGRNDDGYVTFTNIASYTGAIKTADIGTFGVVGSYYAATNLITGAAVIQNLASLENPIGSGIKIRVSRVDVRGTSNAASGTAFLYKVRRTTGLPTGGTIISSVKRDSSFGSANGIVRTGPTATSAAGAIFSGSPGTLANSYGNSANGIREAININFERDELVLSSGEGFVVTADANTISWSHIVNFIWSEVM